MDGDYKRLKFGSILDLIPMCDKITKLTAICYKCKKEALFSYRVTDTSTQVDIGSDNYIPLCRNCYVREKYTL